MALLTVTCGLALSGIAPTPAAAAPAMLANFTWSGGGESDSWSDGCNWTDPPDCGFQIPDDTALFPWNSGVTWDCDINGEGIGELTLDGNVDFDTAGGTVTLGLTKLIISPTEGDVEITVSGTTTITAP